MQNSVKRIVGCAVALGVGAGVPLAWKQFHGKEAAAPKPVAVTAAVPPASTTPPTRHEILREAWDQLMLSKLSPTEKKAAASKLLEQWQQEDLEGAIEAALDGNRLEDAADDGYLTLFDKLVVEKPETFTKLFEAKTFGLDTAILRRSWMRALSQGNPDVLFAQLDRLSPAARQQAFQFCLSAFAKDPARSDSLMATAVKLPDTPGNRTLWASMADASAQRGIPALKAQIVSSSSIGEREVAKAGLSVALSQKLHDEVKATIQDLPADSRKDVLLAILKIKKAYTDSTLVAAEIFMADGDWQTVKTTVARRLNEQSTYYPDPVKLATWGGDLPEQEETEDLYRTCVRPFLSKNAKESKEWLSDFPAGWKRDCALTEYVQVALTRMKKPDEANWAYEQIKDAHFKTLAGDVIAKAKTGK